MLSKAGYTQLYLPVRPKNIAVDHLPYLYKMVEINNEYNNKVTIFVFDENWPMRQMN